MGGNERDRRGLNVALEELHEALPVTLLVDPSDYENRYNEAIDLAKVGELFKSQGLHDLEEMLRHTRDGCTWKEIGERMNCDSNVAQRRFRRWLHRTARSLKLAE